MVKETGKKVQRVQRVNNERRMREVGVVVRVKKGRPNRMTFFIHSVGQPSFVLTRSSGVDSARPTPNRPPRRPTATAVRHR